MIRSELIAFGEDVEAVIVSDIFVGAASFIRCVVSRLIYLEYFPSVMMLFLHGSLSVLMESI